MDSEPNEKENRPQSVLDLGHPSNAQYQTNMEAIHFKPFLEKTPSVVYAELSDPSRDGRKRRQFWLQVLTLTSKTKADSRNQSLDLTIPVCKSGATQMCPAGARPLRCQTKTPTRRQKVLYLWVHSICTQTRGRTTAVRTQSCGQ